MSGRVKTRKFYLLKNLRKNDREFKLLFDALHYYSLETKQGDKCNLFEITREEVDITPNEI